MKGKSLGVCVQIERLERENFLIYCVFFPIVLCYTFKSGPFLVTNQNEGEKIRKEKKSSKEEGKIFSICREFLFCLLLC
jgi:hypothetical protein